MPAIARRLSRLSALTALLVAAVSASVSAQSPSAPTSPIVLGPHPLLFVDDSGIASADGAVRRIHAARTRSAPVIEAEHPWEGARVYVYGSVYASPEGGYRMWYGSRPLQESPTQRDGRVPGMRGNGFDVVLYAESDDGVTWHDYPKNPVLDHSDTITLSQDPFTSEFLAFHKKPATVRGHPRRVVWLSRSTDMQTWSDPELVFAPDAHDDAWTRAPQERTEVYNMSVYPHAAGFVGLPTIFRVTRERVRDAIAPGQSPVDGPIDVEFATSIDGRAWQRTSRREAVIPRGAPGTFDAGSILGVASVPVHTATETWVYYTAITTGHGAPLPEKRISIGQATWRRHGFASVDAGPDGGVVVTRPLRLEGTDLIVNADASRGRVCVAIQEADGRDIAGLTFDQCVPLDRDDPLGRAQWTGAARLPTDRPVRIAVRMTNARLYSLDAR